MRTIDSRSPGRQATGLRVSGDSHSGLQRDHNEDRFHYDAARGIFLVVDGVGGHAAGEKAADVAVTVVRERLERETGSIEDRIREAIALANNNIHRLASWKPEWRGMGCVLTVAVVQNGTAVIGHVGDTRLYKLRGSQLEKVTRDHSPVGEREDAHELSEAEAMRHPRRNEVYRDVGSEPHEPGDPEFVDIFSVPFERDAALLLCSDGLTDTVSSATIKEIVGSYAGHPYEVVRALIDAANEAGGKDNVTVVYVEGNEFSGAQLPQASREPVTRRTAPASAVTAPRAIARGGRSRGRMVGLVVFAALAAVVAVLLWARWRGIALPVIPWSTGPTVIGVSANESISAAIARALPGSTVVVEPGEYREQLRLKSGVRVRSRVPRGASIRLRGDASEADPAVVAVDVTGAELSGFRIVGDAATPLGTGIYVRNSEVSLWDFEVTGARLKAIEIAAGGAPSLTAGAVHDNPGAGLVVRAQASPRIVHSHFARNGGAERAVPIVIEPGAQVSLSGNVFVGIMPDVLTGLTRAERDAIAQANWFVGSAAPSSRRAPGGRP